jgi:tRNA G10  N-methylase Trm11
VNAYYAAFIPGLQNFIAEVIKERLSDVVIRKLLDGAVIFETETSYDKLNFFCFNNIFACISIMENAEGTGSLEKHIKAAISGGGSAHLRAQIRETAGAQDIIANNSKNFHTFRIVVSRENKPAAIDEKLRAEAEKYITRLSGLKADRSLPDTEFWFLFRSEEKSGGENFSVFMKRLTLRPSWEKFLHKGELPPPLAWTLCRLARLSHTDTILDPFCGYGSIPDAALKHFHITNFTACDNNSEAALYTAARFKKRKNSGFVLHQTDFSLLPSLIAEKSIDAIVTDPPWGQFRETGGGFLEKMFAVFEKLLKDGGRAVVLYANDDGLLKTTPDSFTLQDKIPILLSGKKAAIFQFVKKTS